MAVFAGTLATKIVLLPPKDPESKGVVERRNGFFETSFMPGRHFESPADFNSPVHRLADDGEHPARSHPQGPPGRLGGGRQGGDVAVTAGGAALWAGAIMSDWAGTTTCGWTPTTTPSTLRAIGARVDVTADLDAVRVRHGGQLVAEHSTPMGAWDDGHRPRPCQRGRRAAPRLPTPDHPASGRRAWSATWPTTTKRSASTPSR